MQGKFGPLRPDVPFVTVVDNTSTLFLRNLYSIIGRSIVIHDHRDNANFECATIVSAAELGGMSVVLIVIRRIFVRSTVKLLGQNSHSVVMFNTKLVHFSPILTVCPDKSMYGRASQEFGLKTSDFRL